MKYLKIMPEQECSSLWIGEEEGLYYHLELEDAGFDPDLNRKIIQWANDFDNTLDENYPPDSGFGSKEEEIKFEYTGLEIWKIIVRDYSHLYGHIVYVSYPLEKRYDNILEFENDLELWASSLK